MGLGKTLRALSDGIRRDILDMLKSGAMSAGDIADRFSISGAAISRHLAILKDADLIRDKREGKYIYYELNTSVFEEVIMWMKGFNNEK